MRRATSLLEPLELRCAAVAASSRSSARGSDAQITEFSSAELDLCVTLGSLEGQEPIEEVVPALRGLGEPVLQMSRVLHDSTLAPGTVGLELSTPWSLTAAAAGWGSACGPADCRSSGACLENCDGLCDAMYAAP